MGAEAADHAGGGLGHVGMVAEFLAAVDVREVQLDHRQLAGQQGIHDGDRGVGVAGRIDDDGGVAGARLLDPGDQFALVVGLAEIDLDAERIAPRAGLRLDVGQGLGTVDLRLARAQHVQVRSVQDQDLRRHITVAPRCTDARQAIAAGREWQEDEWPIPGRYPAARWPRDRNKVSFMRGAAAPPGPPPLGCRLPPTAITDPVTGLRGGRLSYVYTVYFG